MGLEVPVAGTKTNSEMYNQLHPLRCSIVVCINSSRLNTFIFVAAKFGNPSLTRPYRRRLHDLRR